MSKNKENTDYRDTLLLPETDLPMRAKLPEKEPEILKDWEKKSLFSRIRESSQDKDKFVLHDGPPYANGNLHMGTALNKILKDVIVRSKQMEGYDCEYRPGWDCHGLPIEWKVEENFREKGKNKDQIPINSFRSECRKFAQKWIEIQKIQFKRLGVLGDWDEPYTTMAYDAEASIVKEFHKFLMSDDLYKGSKPVMWSVVEKTALAEAEVEYLEYTSPTIWVRFPIDNIEEFENVSVLIWTTTPWTIPANRAIAFSSEFDYGLYEVKSSEEDSLTTIGEKIIVNMSLSESVEKASNSELKFLREIKDLGKISCLHPFHSVGYDFKVPLLEADFVADDTGTGFVHVAPSHGQDDYELAIKNNIDIPFTIDDEGIYLQSMGFLAGKRVYNEDGTSGDANGSVIGELINQNNLFSKGKLRHKYPHSWRSKAPLIFRNTPQWFISMENNDLRKKSLDAIDKVKWIPERGKNRIKSMVETRPDWVISRQRAWGVPLALFVNKKSGKLLKDKAVNSRIFELFKSEGSDSWFIREDKDFLGEKYNSEDWEKVNDILDVWFDSGSTHSFVLEGEKGLGWPAQLYLEGSDQHRGWFQSSLLESCGTRGEAPYESVLTHGFVVDKNGRKMSKSEGNYVSPDELVDKYGADVVRLWAVSVDFTEDMKIGQEVMQSNIEAYRKIRNTLRFLLGNLSNFSDDEIVEYKDLPELERYILHRLSEVNDVILDGYDKYDLKIVFQNLLNFSNLDLSSFYFDVRKDSLYCDSKNSLSRKSCRTVLDILFKYLIKWLAPILCFTCEEVWLSRYPNDKQSIHEFTFEKPNKDWIDNELYEKWKKIRSVRKVVTGAIELKRKEKIIGSSLEAFPKVYISDKDHFNILSSVNTDEIFITSQASIIEGEGQEDSFRLDDFPFVSVLIDLAVGKKCQRSWKILPEVGSDPDYPDLSIRDADVMREISENKS
jgi:isoleucyl-tRNA synthetase